MASPPDQVEILRGRDLARIFQLWEERHSIPGYDPEPIVTRLAEIFEEETEVYMRKDPDPFDERHPSRTDPNSELGRMLKTLFRKDHFMTRLVNDYLRDNFFTRQNIQQGSQSLNIAACRLILVIMPGLETSAVFQAEFDHLITRLYSWAESSPEPLQSYATGLLGAAMEVQEIAVSFREQNIRLLPIMLRRLHVLQLAHRNRDRLSEAGEGTSSTAFQRMFQGEAGVINAKSTTGDSMVVDDGLVSRPFAHLGASEMDGELVAANGPTPLSNLNTLFQNENSQNTQDNGQSRSAHRNMIPIYPATIATSQMLILRYLTPMGEYQEFLPHVFEHNAMSLIFRYIENLDAKDTCLAFEALKYLASLLCHKKFSLEFIANGGLERLLKVPRPSLAATGVSIAFYYLAYCEDAMERICLMPQKIITELVSYALWLLGCSHDSGRCHATMFFGLSCQFKTMMDEFDKQDGLRKLYNVIAVLPILLPADDYNLNDDEECAARQVVRHVCVALKKYFENHLYYKYSQVTRQQCLTGTLAHPVFKSVKNSPEVISDQIKTLQELLPMKAPWTPVDEFLTLGGVNLLLRIIALAYEWNYSGRAETVRAALDVLNVCCVIPRVHAVFCERIEFPDEGSAAGINIVLGAAEGEIVADAEVQKSALAVLVNTVCAPIHRPSGSLARFGSAKKRMPNKNSEELLQKVWESVRSNNGIIVLLSLMCVKTPITDADCIRGMACRALAGLARSETVQQIIGKLPLFVNGQLQSLMRDPILQEKRAEHVQFQKYALELMERVSGKAKTFNNQLDTSLADIHKANVVAQTKIQFNEQQLYQLIYQHLAARGLTETAASLVKEANITIPSTLQQQHPQVSTIGRNLHHSPFTFRSPNTSVIQRARIRSKTADSVFNHSAAQANLQAALAAASSDGNCLKDANGSGDTYQLRPADTSGSAGTATVTTAALESLVTEPFTPIKLIKKTNPTCVSAGGPVGGSSSHGTSNSLNTPFSSSSSNSQQRSLQKQISATVDTASFLVPASTSSKTTAQDPVGCSTVTLDTIITEYLTNQHALCKHPMSTCPQFDLFVPHKCPDPRPNRASGMSMNFAARFFKRHAGFSSRRFDRRLVHSNFSASRVLRPQDSDFFFTCCDFTPCATKLITGSHSGEVKIFNLSDSNEEFSYSCHESYLNSIKCSKDGRLLLTSCAWRSPMSVLWNIENNRFSHKLQWDEEEYLEFPNIMQDKVLATTGEVATIYDINTGQKILSLVPNIYNQYSKNRATFCPTDELILSDGVLWDVSSGKEIHKFDKLNQTISGVFHPNGLEIVSNTEVWDLRTFHLLRTVPALDQCYVKFSPQNVIYGICPELESEPNSDNVFFESSFKVLDGYDYSSISTVDVKRNIYDLAINLYGSQIAIVENQGGYNSVQESVVRIYSVGRKKNTEDDAEEEEEEMENSEDNSMSETESVVFHGARGENGGQRRRRRRGMRINVLDDEDDIFQPGSSSSSEDDDDDDDNEDDDDGAGDGGDDENDDAEDDDGGNNNDDEADEEDASSWTTTSDLEDFLLL